MLRDMMESILKNSDTVLGVEWKSGPNSSELLLEQEDGRGRMVFHPLFPGVTLAFIQVNASNWPESEANAELRPLLINYCVAGRSELLLDDGAYIYLKENDFAVSEQTAQDGYIFPTRLYQGIKIYFDIEQLSHHAQELMSAFELDFTLLRENYCRRQKTYINEADSTLTAIFRKLWALSEQPSLFYLRIYTLELIYELLHTEPRPSKTCGFYTELQVGIAKKAEQILTADLRKHIPVRLLAEKFSVSRQIIVGDIALLRSSGEEILATPRGYVTPKEARGILRRVAVKHTPQEMEAELNAIVDNGCTVIDVIVDHPIYGQLTGPLQISNRYEVSQFIERCKKAEPLSSLTDGIHLHTLSCPDEAAFERTKSALRALRVLLEENGN